MQGFYFYLKFEQFWINTEEMISNEMNIPIWVIE